MTRRIEYVVVYNAFGQVVLFQRFHSQEGILDFLSLSHGVYTLRVSTPAGRVAVKVVK